MSVRHKIQKDNTY